MTSAIRCFKVPRNVFSLSKFCKLTQKESLLPHRSLILKGTLSYSQIADSQKKSSNSNIDVSEAFISFKYLRLIKRAIREFGPYVEENQKLAFLLERARKHNMPDNFIDFAMNISVDDRARIGLLEVLLMNHCHLIIQYEDIDNSMTKAHTLRLCAMNEVHLHQGEAKWPLYFDQIGLLSVKSDAIVSLFNNPNEAQVAVKVGAQTVKKEIDHEGVSYWQFYCDPGDLHEVRKQLSNEGYEVEESYVGYIPKKRIALPDFSRNTVCSVITELNKIPAVDNVFINMM